MILLDIKLNNGIFKTFKIKNTLHVIDFFLYIKMIYCSKIKICVGSVSTTTFSSTLKKFSPGILA